MLYDTLETFAAILSLVCMFVTLVCIIFSVKKNRIPTLVAITGCILYAMFLALAKPDMTISQYKTFSILFLGFAFFAIVAYTTYLEAKKNKQQSEKKFEKFKRECIEARQGVLVI